MNKEKIVITGGLGYIGSELCKFYSGEARFKNIVVTDKRFISERVKQLRDWGIDFIQAPILDEKMKEILFDADIVIHLAGITDVAYTKTQSNEQQDEEIRKTGIEGTRNIIKYAKPGCKIIFPSTHVVYEGLSEAKAEIDETEPPCPVLTYAKGKVQSEIDLFNSDKNFVVLRLGSVYGYSTDTMRIGIMPNLFSKIASQDGTIELFSNGIQLKSLVPVLDVARCMKFMAESNISREIFHVSLENTTVKEVARLCKEINPKLKIIETNDEIPNLGYTISNKKLISTGFEFKYNLKSCLKEMIANWSKRDINTALEYFDRGGKELVDERGIILNYELTEPINMIGLIQSKKGSVRANHYHPVQEQKCLLVKGQYISAVKDLSDPDTQIETRVVNEGDISIIKPNVAHTMIFTEDSLFLNLVRGEREHENYGVTHTMPYKLVDDRFKDMLLQTYKTKCRSCGNMRLDRVVSLGLSPLANNLVDSIDCIVEKYPLEMNYCPKCHNCQLSIVISPEKMFDNYLYASSTAATFRKHFEDAAIKYIDEFKLNSNTLVVDIGSNDGIALKPLKEKGIKVVGVEPAKNIAQLAIQNGIPTENLYFNSEAVEKIVSKYGKAKLVTASNVFAHSDFLKEMAADCFKLLEENGTLIIEVQYLYDVMKYLSFDNIYHEHTNYWSVTSLNNFFNSLGFCVHKVEHIDTHGGSIRVYVGRNGQNISESVNKFLASEKEFGLTGFERYKKFGSDVLAIKNKIIENFKLLKKNNIICGYGAPAKATTALNFYGIGSEYISYTVEDSPLKDGKYIPGVNIPIKNKQYFLNNLPNIVVVFAWNFFDYIVKNNEELVKKGVKFISIKELEK